MPDIVVPVDENLRLELVNAFMEEEGDVLLNEHSVDEFNGLKAEVFSAEHSPPHFRIEYAGVTARFTIADCSPLDGNSLKKQHKAIKEWFGKNKAAIVKKWNDTRPHGCQVGKINADGTKLVEPK